MQIKHTKTALNPDTGDASMVQPSDWNADHTWTGPVVIDADTTYTVNVDGSGSYADIPSCFDDINKFIVGNQAKITVNLNAGIHNIGREISFCNLNTNLVQILGSAPLGPFTSTSVSVSGSAGAWVNVITPAQAVDTNLILPGMYVMVYASTLSTNGARMWGCHKITAVTPTTITVLNTNRSAAGPSGTTGLSFYVFTSVIKTTISGMHVMHVHSGAAMGSSQINFPALKNIVIEGPSLATASGYGIFVNQASSMYIGDTVQAYSKVGVSGMGQNVWVGDNSYLLTSNRYLTSSSGGDSGIVAADSGHVAINNGAIFTGARVNGTSIGMYAVMGGTVIASGVIMVGNNYGCFAQYNAMIRNNSPTSDEWVTAQSSPAVNTTPTHAANTLGYVITV